MLNKRTISRVCKHCQNPFLASASAVNRGGGLFCGIPCFKASKGSFIERFWKNVNKDGPIPAHVPELGPCWVWTASISGGPPGHRYGQISIKGKMRRAHRFSWELANEPIPKGKHVLHRCDNPCCVNPSHLFIGTPRENFEDMRAKGRYRNGIGERCSLSKLTSHQVLEIRARYAAGGIGYRKLAKAYGVTRQCIQEIIQRVNWKHI